MKLERELHREGIIPIEEACWKFKLDLSVFQKIISDFFECRASYEQELQSIDSMLSFARN